jgi:hypothetical protein
MWNRQHVYRVAGGQILPAPSVIRLSALAAALVAFSATAQAQTTPNLLSNDRLLPFTDLLNAPNVLPTNLQRSRSTTARRPRSAVRG